MISVFISLICGLFMFIACVWVYCWLSRLFVVTYLVAGLVVVCYLVVVV